MGVTQRVARVSLRQLIRVFIRLFAAQLKIVVFFKQMFDFCRNVADFGCTVQRRLGGSRYFCNWATIGSATMINFFIVSGTCTIKFKCKSSYLKYNIINVIIFK